MPRIKPTNIMYVSMALFLACLFLPSFQTKGALFAPDGWLILLIGWLELIDGGFRWFANPLIMASWYYLRKNEVKTAHKVGSIALIVALSFLLQDDVLRDEAGGRDPIVGYWPGYFLWLASMAVVVVGAFFSYGYRSDQTADLMRDSHDRV